MPYVEAMGSMRSPCSGYGVPRTPIPSDPPTPGLWVPLYGALRPLRALGCAGPLFRGDGAVGHTEDSPIALGSHSLSVGGVGGVGFPGAVSVSAPRFKNKVSK